MKDINYITSISEICCGPEGQTMSNNNNVLFQRDEEGDSDAWDDTALIKAYDDAVSTLKAKLAAHHPEYSVSNNSSSKKKKKSKQKAKKKKSNTSKSSHTWKAGDFCQAYYTEDGELYSAQILRMNDDDTCLVKYLDYGNEENQYLDSLLPALSEASSQDNKTETASEADSVSEIAKEKQTSRRKSKRETYVGGQPSNSNPPWNWNNFAIPQPPPPAPSPYPFPAFPNPNFPGHAGFGTTAQFPPVFPGIPPPPPLLNGQGTGNDNEALYSMLISWYMSGYHTGYYQGLKNAKSSSHHSGPLR